jgi:hypothetical protein
MKASRQGIDLYRPDCDRSIASESPQRCKLTEEQISDDLWLDGLDEMKIKARSA